MAGLSSVDDQSFLSEVLESVGKVLVVFWAPWCGPCRIVHPVLEEINDEYPNTKILSLNIDDNPKTPTDYQIMSIPTMLVFKDGAVVKKAIGAMPKRRLLAELEDFLA